MLHQDKDINFIWNKGGEMIKYELWESYVVEFKEPSVEKYDSQCLSLLSQPMRQMKEIYVSTGPMQLWNLVTYVQPLTLRIV